MNKVYSFVFLTGLAVLATPLFASGGCGGMSLSRIQSLAASARGVSGNNAASFQIGASAASSALPDFDTNNAPIVGLWDITFTSGGQVVDEGFDAWHGDGTETLNDNPPPATGNVCLGVWKQTGRRSFTLKHPSWIYDEATNTQVIGRVYIHENVTVSKDGNSFSGPYSIDAFDTFGNLLGHVEGTVSATRIKPE